MSNFSLTCLAIKVFFFLIDNENGNSHKIFGNPKEKKLTMNKDICLLHYKLGIIPSFSGLGWQLTQP